MWSISVEPMPSMIRMPVALVPASDTPAGQRLARRDALLQRRQVDRAVAQQPAIHRRRGEQRRAPCALDGLEQRLRRGFSTSTVEAPKRSGNSTSPPRPKVNASGGVPQKTSSAEGAGSRARRCRSIASTSRWKCTLPFGLPVVPEVKAMSATSSAAVSTGVERAARRQVLERRATRTRRRRDAPSSSPAQAPRGPRLPGACERMRLRLRRSTFVSSSARSSGMVATTTPPAIITPSTRPSLGCWARAAARGCPA